MGREMILVGRSLSLKNFLRIRLQLRNLMGSQKVFLLKKHDVSLHKCKQLKNEKKRKRMSMVRSCTESNTNIREEILVLNYIRS